MKIFEVTPSLRSEYNNKLRDFERTFKYPLGDDSFFIDHGVDYFAFFDKLGKSFVYIGEKKNKVVAAVIVVLRKLDIYNNNSYKTIWYICDLKIHPDYRGGSFIQRVVQDASAKYGHLSPIIYGISMNSIGRPNRLIYLASRIKSLNLRLSGELNFYLLNNFQLNKIERKLIDRYGAVNFISLLGKKDLILTSTNTLLPILHFSFTTSSERVSSNLKHAYQYMFCFSTKASINTEFMDLNLHPTATASILSNIENCDWKFIETCDI